VQPEFAGFAGSSSLISNICRCLIVAAALALPGSAVVFGQGATCSSIYQACYEKSVQGMPPAKAKADCNQAISQCKRTGCFVGPHSGTTFACNLVKQ